MGAIKKQVIFTVHPPVEFVYALNFIANEEDLYKFYLDFNFTPEEAFKKAIEEMKGRLSRFVKGELLYFFQWQDIMSVLGSIIIENENLQGVPDLITLMEQIPEKELQSYIMLQALYGTYTTDENRARWKSRAHSPARLYQLICDLDNKSSADKEKLLECAENPSEIKSRLCFLLKHFYEKCYRPIEEGILSVLETAKERYERVFHENPDYFNSEYLGRLLDADDAGFIIHISYFNQIRAWLFYVKPYNHTRLVSLGIHTENYPRKVYIRAKVQKFVKILADKKRFEVIELLGKRPYYVYELANELKLTSATVCYHLNSMLDLNLVSMERGNSKTYYTLNRETIRELLDNAAEVLLADNERTTDKEA